MMDDLQKRLWLFQNKIRFLLTPPAKRVRLEVAVDGRQLTFLLVSLHALGYALHVVESPMIFRELLNLSKSAPIPFIVGGAEQDCFLVMSDRADVVEKVIKEGRRGILLDDDFFNSVKVGFRMPYFMHPSVYHAGLDKLIAPPLDGERAVRIGFFGTRDAVFYTENFRFPIMNREEILTIFIEKFGSGITQARIPVSTWGKQEIIMSVDIRGGDRDRHPKSFLPLPDYLEALRNCDFFLSPPGWCIPLSHNLIEGMAAGAIPIINSAEYLYPNLVHGKECLSYSTPDELNTTVEAALAMPSSELKRMRANVIGYYNENLKPGGWFRKSLQQGDRRILVNAEEISLGITPPSYS